MPSKITIKAHKRIIHKSHKKTRSSKPRKITVRKLGKRGKRTHRKRVRGGMGEDEQPPKRGRGRPKGSKNKPKPPAAGDEPEPEPEHVTEPETESITIGEN